MEVHSFFWQLAVVLVTARAFAEIASRLNAPSVIGELLAGVCLGPSLLGVIEPSEVFMLMAEFGILLLLFEVGIETDLRRLIQTGLKAFTVATGGFLLPFLFGFALSFYTFHLPLLMSLFAGGTLTATSIGITVRILVDLKRQRSHEAQIVLGAAVLDDVLGVILLALLYEFSVAGGIHWGNAAKVFLFIIIFLAIAPPFAKPLARFIQRLEQNTSIPGLIPTAIVAIILFFAWLAHEVGAPEILGGFAAGLALSRRFFLPFGAALHIDEGFARRVEDQMRPIVQLFTPVFFVMVGVSLDLTAVDWASPFIWLFTPILLLLAVAGKIGGALLIREPPLRRLAIGLAMVPRGEVGLVFAELGKTSGIFDENLYAALILVVAATTLFTPFALQGFYRRYGRSLEHPP